MDEIIEKIVEAYFVEIRDNDDATNGDAFKAILEALEVEDLIRLMLIKGYSVTLEVTEERYSTATSNWS